MSTARKYLVLLTFLTCVLIHSWVYPAFAEGANLQGFWVVYAQPDETLVPLRGTTCCFSRCTTIEGVWIPVPYAGTLDVQQIGNAIRGSENFGQSTILTPLTLEGTVDGNNVNFRIYGSRRPRQGDVIDYLYEFSGVISPGMSEIVPSGTRDIAGSYTETTHWLFQNGSCTDERNFNLSGRFEVTILNPSGCRIEITGPSTVWVYEPMSKSPKISLQAVADPSGGKYNWKILSGQDKIRFIGNTKRQTVSVQGIAPSETENDVVINLTYTVDSKSCESIHYITVQEPIEGPHIFEKSQDQDGNWEWKEGWQTVPRAIITHGWQNTIEGDFGWLVKLADAIHGSDLGKDIQVGAWFWQQEATGTAPIPFGPRTAYKNVDSQAKLLAASLKPYIESGKPITLFGHS